MQKAPRKQPRKISQSYLENAALYYLQRYASSVANFRKVMHRKIKKSEQFHGTVPAESYDWVEKLIERYIKAGLLNDNIFAESKVNSMRRKGYSSTKIKGNLAQKGIDTALSEQLIDPTDDLEAAMTYARRRRIGPFRTRTVENAAQKDMATLARQGFSYEIVRQVIDFNAEE